MGIRFNSSADLKISPGLSLSSRRDEVQESLSTRKELIEVKPVTNEQEHPAGSNENRDRDNGGMIKSTKSLKGRNRMQVTEDLN